MAKVIAMNIKKMFMIILVALVSILVIMAFYSNRHKFSSLDTVRYMTISINNPVSAFELAEKYSDLRTKERFVTELKKVNGLSSADNIEKSTVLIPVFGSK